MTRGAPNPEPAYSRLVRGELCVWEPGQVISRHKICAGPDKINGRGLTISNDKPKPLTGVTVRDCMIQGDGDDALCIWGNVRRVTIERCWVIGTHQWPDKLDYRLVNKCFIAGADPSQPDPDYPDWFTARDCTFGGGFRAPAIRGGVFRFERCSCGPSRRNEWTRVRGDIIDCDFTVQVGMKVWADGIGDNPWSDSQDRFVRPLCLREPKPDSLYFSGCTLTVLDSAGNVIRSGPADGPALCRAWTDGRDDQVGLDPDVPALTFRTKPNRG